MDTLLSVAVTAGFVVTVNDILAVHEYAVYADPMMMLLDVFSTS